MGLRDILPREDIGAFSTAIEEYRDSLLETAANADAALQLAELESRLGDRDSAETYYKHALRRNDAFAPAHHAYGLFLVRLQEHAEAFEHIRKAADLDRSNARFVYVYGVAANSLGRRDEALEILTDAWRRFPENFDIGYALATILRDSGEHEDALSVASELKEKFPDIVIAGDLWRSLVKQQ